ncbi:MAG: hypothetical protein PWQ55_1153 [Chloroflexota bacterium]|nr:hypothetical protein [Chloroflexota bacterium]
MKKVAVMLPSNYKGGSLRAAKNIAKSIAFQACKRSDGIQVVFSYVADGDYDIDLDFSDLTAEGITLRETQWKIIPKANLLSAASMLGIAADTLKFDAYCLPTDGANDLLDCDLWLIISNRLPAPLFPMRRHAFVIYDFIERYIPEIFKDIQAFWDAYVVNFISSLRDAARVFVTTPSTQQDLIAYAGVTKESIHMLPMDFHPPELSKTDAGLDIPGKFIFWPTNTTQHKNHLNTLRAYEIYRLELGGAYDLVISGPMTEVFDPHYRLEADSPMLSYTHIRAVREKLHRDAHLAENIHIMGNIPDRTYTDVLSKASFLWHPTLYDNGTFTVLEAAYLGVPSLSANYPAMQFMDQRFKLNLTFFNPNNPDEMARALKSMESTSGKIKLPDKKSLARFGWKNLSASIYDEISRLMN